jgi:hypothetical protein
MFSDYSAHIWPQIGPAHWISKKKEKEKEKRVILRSI